MNINFIISLTFFRLIFSASYNYHLIDGIEQTIYIAKYNNSNYFYFYTEVTNSKNVRFNIKSQKVCVLNKRFFINEYDEDNSYYNRSIDKNFNQKNLNNTCLFFHLHNISSTKTKYIRFGTELHFDVFYYNIMTITVRIDLVFEEFSLYNGKPLDIYNLDLNNNSFYLYLEFFDKININLIINNMTQDPFSNIYIHELEKRGNSPSIQIINKTISFIKKNNQLISSFSYISSFSNYTKCLALQIKPSLNISHITAEFDYSVTSFDLIDDNWTTFENLSSNEIYLFFIEVVELSKVNISLLMNYSVINNTNYEYEDYELPAIDLDGNLLEFNPSDSIPLDYIDINIYEYKKKNNSFNSYNQKNSKRLKRINDNYFVAEEIYQVNRTDTNYFAFSFKPNFNISVMQVNIKISGGIFQLFNNISKNITKLKSKEDYLFYTTTRKFNYIRLTLTMNYNSNMTTAPFLNILFQELDYNGYNKGVSIKHNKSVSSIRDGDQLIISSSYNISDTSTNYIIFKINPLYNIDYMIANIDEIIGYINIDNYKNFQGIYYFFKSHFKYYIEMNAWQNYITKFNLKAYNVSKAPFSSLKIYDCYYNYRDLSYCHKNRTQKIKFKKNNDRYEASFEKKIP